MEVLLWLCFIVPGIIYSVWRLASRYQGCQKCGSKRIIPVDSPTAKAALGVLPQVSQPRPSRFCVKCGKPISTGSRFCAHCGTAVDG
jgi:DNA-directed RNA polymerase subunit RPC12/RpoP